MSFGCSTPLHITLFHGTHAPSTARVPPGTEIKKLHRPPMDNAELAEQDLELLSKELGRRFDEKLFLLSSELSLAKTAFHRASSSPVFKMGQWLWKSGVLKLGSAVPWNLQAHNTGKRDVCHVCHVCDDAGLAKRRCG